VKSCLLQSSVKLLEYQSLALPTKYSHHERIEQSLANSSYKSEHQLTIDWKKPASHAFPTSITLHPCRISVLIPSPCLPLAPLVATDLGSFWQHPPALEQELCTPPNAELVGIGNDGLIACGNEAHHFPEFGKLETKVERERRTHERNSPSQFSNTLSLGKVYALQDVHVSRCGFRSWRIVCHIWT